MKYENFIENNLEEFKKSKNNSFEQFIDNGRIITFKKINNQVEVYTSSTSIGVDEMKLIFNYNLT